MKKPKINYLLRVYFAGGAVQRVQTNKIRRIYSKLQVIKKSEIEKCYVGASYGVTEDNFGNKTKFQNEGIYQNPLELAQALKCFAESDDAFS